jgi:hypothetical protein
MTAAERRMFKTTLRAALRGRARGLVLSVAEDSALIRLIKFRDVDPNGAKLIAAWASGVPALTTVAHCEGCCTKTLLARIDAILKEYLGA